MCDLPGFSPHDLVVLWFSSRVDFDIAARVAGEERVPVKDLGAMRLLVPGALQVRFDGLHFESSRLA